MAFYVTFSGPGQKHPDYLLHARYEHWSNVLECVQRLNAQGHIIDKQAQTLRVLTQTANDPDPDTNYQDNEIELVNRTGKYTGYVLTIEGSLTTP